MLTRTRVLEEACPWLLVSLVSDERELLTEAKT
jgi:hypothetical protein